MQHHTNRIIHQLLIKGHGESCLRRAMSWETSYRHKLTYSISVVSITFPLYHKPMLAKQLHVCKYYQLYSNETPYNTQEFIK